MPEPTAQSKELEALSRSLLTAVRILEPAAIVGAVVGVVLRNYLCACRDAGDLARHSGQDSLTNSHPYGAAGIAISVVSLLGGATMCAIARGLRLFLFDVATRRGIENG